MYYYQDEPVGYDFELAQDLAKYLDVELAVKVANTENELRQMLNQGDIDLIAYNYTENALFSNTLSGEETTSHSFAELPYHLTPTHGQGHIALVQRKDEQKIDRITQLRDKSVTVIRNSIFHQQLLHINEETGGDIRILLVSDSTINDSLIAQVADSKIDYALSYDSHFAALAADYPNLDASIPVSFSYPMGWISRKQSVHLNDVLDSWWSSRKPWFISRLRDKYWAPHALEEINPEQVEEVPEQVEQKAAIEREKQDKAAQDKAEKKRIAQEKKEAREAAKKARDEEKKEASEDDTKKTEETDNDAKDEEKNEGKKKEKTEKTPSGHISPYDAYFKKYAPTIPWDWRLMAALCYTESRFNPNVRSHMGAMGLMQLVPKTGAKFGLNSSNAYNPEKNIAAGAQLIKSLCMIYSSVTNPEERVCFVLASYNAGAAHIKDAQKLAAKYGANPHVWHGNVEYYMRKLKEPAYYNDPVCRYGYFRGDGVCAYVDNVLARYRKYKTIAN